MRRSAYWASTHPCYSGSGYTCDCGHHSRSEREHNEHVRSVHAGDKDFCAKVLSWRQFRKLFPDAK